MCGAIQLWGSYSSYSSEVLPDVYNLWGKNSNRRSGGEVFSMSWKPHFLKLCSILYLGLCLSEMTNDCIAILGMCCSLYVLPCLELLVSKAFLFYFLQKFNTLTCYVRYLFFRFVQLFSFPFILLPQLFQVQCVSGKGDMPLSSAGSATLTEDIYEKTEHLFASSNVSLKKDGDKVKMEINQQPGHLPLVLCIAVRGLASLAHSDWTKDSR